MKWLSVLAMLLITCSACKAGSSPQYEGNDSHQYSTRSAEVTIQVQPGEVVHVVGVSPSPSPTATPPSPIPSQTPTPTPTPPPVAGNECPSGHCIYVSSSTGSDSNDGSSPTKAFASIGKANNSLATLRPGDRLLFKSNDTWRGNGSNNTSLVLGDAPAHVLRGSKSAPIYITTYSGPAPATFDMMNAQPYCIASVLMAGSGTGNPVPTAQAPQYVTVKNIKCLHAYSQGITFNANNGNEPGIVIDGNTLQNTGPHCAHKTGACYPPGELPPAWQASKAYAANSASTNSIIYPNSNNSGKFWYMQIAGNCIAGSKQPTWNQTVNNLTPDGNCSWRTLPVRGVYKNQLQGADFGSTGGADGFTIVNNNVSWSGGHNAIQGHHDLGAFLADGNWVGPTFQHGGIDVKGVGADAANPARISNNHIHCGASEGACGDQTGSQTSGVPGIYTQTDWNNIVEHLVVQGNEIWDTFVGISINPSPNVPACSPNPCPIQAKVYNNTVHMPMKVTNPVTGWWALYGNGGNGNRTNSSMEAKNNIFDGGSVSVGKWPAGTVEDYDDIGGEQGSRSYSFNGSSKPGAHSICPSGCPAGNKTDPLYVNSSSQPPNFKLKIGSPCAGSGQPGLTAGNRNMGAW